MLGALFNSRPLAVLVLMLALLLAAIRICSASKSGTNDSHEAAARDADR